ncbi:hypothetical protein [Neolewinella persica]|uniref:hypothetical protein n=1 Tax=Neolewinella persica TaxID=70998 RepID=UPI000378510D|nr:hypothetical protein [Neolewinella persica]
MAIKEITLWYDNRLEGATELLHYEVLTTTDGGTTWTSRKVDKDCNYDLPYQVNPTRTPNGGFLTVTSRANLITFDN